MTRKNRFAYTTLPVLLTLIAVALAGCTQPGTPGDGDDLTPAESHARIMETARQVAEDLDTPEEALAAGYVPDEACIPGMGVHWIHKPGQADSRFDTTLEEDRPEVLLFLPDDANLSDTSGDTFLGIEYVVVTQGTEMNSSGSVPSLHGRSFYGPMAGHTPEMPWHAELHVFLADGLESPVSFPEEQPDKIVCPKGTTPPELAAHGQVMAKARSVAEGLDTPEEALAAGYEPDEFCIPGMGVHWIHKPGQPDSALDTELNPDMPEVVLFLPNDGNTSNVTGDRFLAIEYVVVTEGTDFNSSEALPTVMGARLYGPMPGHEPGMPWHAELHVYLAEGLASTPDFPEAQPDAIVCPEGTTPPMFG